MIPLQLLSVESNLNLKSVKLCEKGLEESVFVWGGSFRSFKSIKRYLKLYFLHSIREFMILHLLHQHFKFKPQTFPNRKAFDLKRCENGAFQKVPAGIKLLDSCCLNRLFTLTLDCLHPPDPLVLCFTPPLCRVVNFVVLWRNSLSHAEDFSSGVLH